MNLDAFDGNIEKWFEERKITDFPGGTDYVTIYKSIRQALEPLHKEVTAGADYTDDTSLTWHDKSHINKVIHQVSRLVSYKNVELTAFEVFSLLVAIQIHDVKNIEGRNKHEETAIKIFTDLKIDGLIDSILQKNIGFIASSHAGSYNVGGRVEKDKIRLLKPDEFKGAKKIRLRVLAALLRLADEFADDSERAMNFLLSAGKIKKGSIIHQMHAKCLIDVNIEPNSGKVDFDYHLNVEDATTKFAKYFKERDAYEDIYLLDEIFERTLKSHYETVYCMRFLRPDISINKLHISIEIEHSDIHKQLNISYELEEAGYPTSNQSIFELCGDKYLKQNGGYWNGENLKHYLEVNGYLS